MPGSVKKKLPVLPQYTRAELMNHSEALFAVKAEVLAGALHEAAHQSFSIAEAQTRINQFLKAKVKE
ncbi:hypothetical protein [Paenibacillus silvae]|uniref:YqzN/YkzM domain-containing protein n=1 Tax=Paenibacillus silvae TaxID=1325358 RepID=A0A2W6NAV7_9BACL|nr:hypothetical protein [Paenibacillus silvae]PZT52739.1 hypothetical protein DN757_25865 [Paenibacillus silvae]